MLTVGILGCGKMGKVYARWFSQNSNCKVKAFYNRTKALAEELSVKYNGSMVYDSWEEMLEDDEIDIIGICSPSFQHEKQFIAAAKKNKHILCEKPMANDVNACRAMVQSTKNRKIKTMVGFQMRYHPVVEKVNTLIDKVGNIIMVEMSLTMHRPEINWKHKLDQGGGVMKELASHLIDLTSLWCGNIEAVIGRNVVIQPGREVEDISVSLLKFSNGATGLIKADYWNHEKSVIKGTIVGTKGQIEFKFSSYDPVDSEVYFIQNGQKTRIEVELSTQIDEVYPGHLDSFMKEINSFVNAIKNDLDISESCEAGVKSLEVIDASYISSKTDSWQRLPLKEFDLNDLSSCFEIIKIGE